MASLDATSNTFAGPDNQDSATVADFGSEWGRFQQDAIPEELDEISKKYFGIFPWSELPEKAVGFDMGCGSGRWAAFVAPQVEKLFCVDASSEALSVARKNLSGCGNCEFAHSTADQFSAPDGSMDFGYSLGVLHHIPDTQQALNRCVAKLKPGAPFLCYLYYDFENRSPAFRTLWKASDAVRKKIAPLPNVIKHRITDGLAAFAYFPLARTAGLMEKAGLDTDAVPLSFYKDCSFYTMRTDALDRFGTRLEQRFSRADITRMMETAGLRDVRFSDETPYWVSVGIKA